MMDVQKNEHFPDVEDVLPNTFDATSPALCLVDVRREEELRSEMGYIRGSKWILLDELPKRMEELPKDKPIIFVCHSGGRSARATQYALSQGLTQVYNLRGGMILWNELGLPVTKE